VGFRNVGGLREERLSEDLLLSIGLCFRRAAGEPTDVQALGRQLVVVL